MKRTRAGLALLVVLAAAGIVLAQNAGSKRTLIVNGQTTEVPVIYVGGRAYAGLEALAEAIHGSLSSSGQVFALSLPTALPAGAPATSDATAAPTSPSVSSGTPSPASDPGFSREFLNAGIEEMSTLREWHTALATAIENGIPLSASFLAPYRNQATTNLRRASVAAHTPSDKSGYQLLENVFQNMVKLTDKYLNMRSNLTYISPDALKNDALDQRIIACGRSLSAIAASGQFADEGLCH